ncbi:MAG: DEAD/DEAH box helicase [Tessaracoccus sp.]
MSEETFADLGLNESITSALAEAGIVHPFPIQALAIPLALGGTDLIGQARTGTGKTLAFGTSMLHRMELLNEEEPATHGKPRGLVVCPTRELALQVGRDLAVAGAKLNTRVLTIYGGTGYDEQINTLAAGVDVVVGTPGRLLDLVQRRNLDLREIQVLVLDEADEMLDLGFLPDVERILAKTPKSRQTMLFSATMPVPILTLARATLNRPVNIRAEGENAQATVPDIDQFIYQAHDLDKPEIVARVVQAEGAGKLMVFCRTKRAAQRLSDELVDRGFAAAAIHGDLNQAARERALKKFRSGTIKVLVATDVAARGIDITGVTHVINYECPDTDATYVHRIGRTGRAGNSGVAITLVDWQDVQRWKLIDKALELGKGEISETYSSSPHLYTDLGIPEGTKGRVPGTRSHHRDQEPKQEREGEQGRGRRRRSRGERSERSDHAPKEHGAPRGEQAEGESSPRPRRRRRRIRGGVEVSKPSE